MSFFDGLDAFLRGASDWIGTSRALTDLESIDDEFTFITREGALMSVILLRGVRTMADWTMFEGQIDAINTELSSRLSKPGHSLVVHYCFDPFRHDASDRCIEDMKATARQIGLDLDDVLDEFGAQVARFTQEEECFIVAYTRPAALPKSLERSQKSARAKRIAQNILVNADGQQPERLLPELRNIHSAFVQGLLEVLNGVRVQMVAELVEVHRAVWHMRSALYPSQTSPNWKPVLPGDRIPLRMNDQGTWATVSDINFPALHQQIFKSNIERVDVSTLKIDGRYARAICMSLPPQNPQPFDALFSRLVNADYVFRMAFHIDSDGLGLLGWKGILASILYVTSAQNRQIVRAKAELKHLVETAGAVDVRFRVTASVFAPTMDVLERAAAEMSGAIQSWGSADTEIPMGSAQPIALMATIPGLMGRTTAVNCAAPLREVLPMLPWLRPASIWNTGMPFRSADGRVLPFQQGSSRQTSFIDLGCGPMGYGKSVSVNAYNLAFLLSPGVSRLPWLSILDVGPSSSGLVLMLKDALPPDKKHLAIYERLRMDPDKYGINPFDLPLGARKPLPSKVFNLVNLISLIGTPYEKDAPAEDVPGLARALIEKVYDDFSDEHNPKLYVPHSAPNDADVVHVDQMVEKLGLRIGRHTSWFDLCDEFFDRGFIREAGIAHRRAMPLLRDLSALTRHESVVRVYGQEVCDHLWRRLIEAEGAYPILCVPTRFTLGEAQIVSLDIDEIAPKGTAVADRQTAVMYLVVSEILSGRFFVMPEDVRMMPPRYQAYHTERIERIRNDPKRLVFDELHRVAKNSSVAAKVVRDLETAARESRKWNLHIGLYSQDPGDFPPVMAGFATTVFVFGVGSAQVAQRAGEVFSLSEAAVDACIKRLTKPGPRGSTAVVKFSTDAGMINQFIMISLGSRMLWALSSTTEDTYVRTKLSQRLTPKVARDLLARHYKGGSIKSLYERLRLNMINHEPMGGNFDEIYARMQRQRGEVGDVIDARDLIVESLLDLYEKEMRRTR